MSGRVKRNPEMDALLNALARPIYSWRMSGVNDRPGSQAAYDRAVMEVEDMIRRWVRDHPEQPDDVEPRRHTRDDVLASMDETAARLRRSKRDILQGEREEDR